MAMSEIKKIIVLGASLTDSNWWTWKDFVEMDTGCKLVNLAKKGCGNEFMTHSLVKNKNLLDENTLVIAMLTSIDKFDWFVGVNEFNKLLNEKHAPIDFGKHNGFWCTGCWFPGKKQIYHDNFYNEDYFVTKTIQQILLFERLSEIYKCKIIITFDSPVWTYTEKELLSLSINETQNKLLSHTLSDHWAEVLNQEYVNITRKSLIGFCMIENLPWFDQHYKAHPPAGSHYKWYRNVLSVELQKYINFDFNDDYIEKIKTMDNLWQQEF